jgi:hypothetical protein
MKANLLFIAAFEFCNCQDQENPLLKPAEEY